MKTRAYRTSIIRELKQSKARFLSILVIIFLGVAFYGGIKAAGPMMQETMEDFYDETNLMDTRVVSTLGLTENDLNVLHNNEKIASYYGTYSVDANVMNLNSVVRFMAYETEQQVNQLSVVEGRLPEKSGEIALSTEAKRGNPDLVIGSTYTIESDKDTMESFGRDTFEIVGFVQSPMYIDQMTIGVTTVGDGTIDYYAVLPAQDFALDVYTEIYVTFKDVEGIAAYSDEYKSKMEANNEYLEELFAERLEARREELREEAYVEINEGYEEVEDGEQQLADAREELAQGKIDLEDGQKEYDQAVIDFEKQIKESEQELVKAERDLTAGEQEIASQKKTLEEGKKQLEQAKAQLEEAEAQLKDQGIDPEQDVSELQSTVNELDAASAQYTALSQDMQETIATLEEGEELSVEKIAAWKQTALALGLTDLEGLFDTLEQDRTQVALVQTMIPVLQGAAQTMEETKASLVVLIDGLNEYQAGKAQYTAAKSTIDNGEEQLKAAERTIATGKIELANGKKALEEGKIEGQKALEDAKDELKQGELDLIAGEEEIEDNEKKLAEARGELVEAEEEVTKLVSEGKVYYFDRNDNSGYSEFQDVVDRLAAIASIFPLVFFGIAVLICLTTMTRMVEENRTEIGTLKALGYSNTEIAKKYVIYAAVASLVGGILGVFVGFNLFPSVIVMAYSSLYAMPKMQTIYYTSYIVQSLVISNVCTVGAVLVVLKVDLRSNPSKLMRPKAPKMGKRILLERITPIWSRLNFNYKVTCRNLFRYKQRMFMTIFGIAACTAMIMTGFGLQDSINGLTATQFEKIWNYDAIVIFEDNISQKRQDKYNETVQQLPQYEGSLNLYQENVSFVKEGMNKQNVTLYVPEQAEDLSEYVLLNDRKTGEEYTLGDSGVVINEKLAKLLGVKVGDEITMQTDEKEAYTVVVSAIAESYLSHFMYMSPSYYRQIFGEEVVVNSQLVRLDLLETEGSILATQLLECKGIVNVTMVGDIANSSEDVMGSLNIVVIILIVAAGGLAFVVLYNLNNINVSERIRELSTIKVLGFYDGEVSMYIFRENMILTILGIIAGIGFGRVLHRFVILTAESDNMMMSPNMYSQTYVYSIVLTLLFSAIVMGIMHNKLKNIDMIDALKSNE